MFYLIVSLISLYLLWISRVGICVNFKLVNNWKFHVKISNFKSLTKSYFSKLLTNHYHFTITKMSTLDFPQHKVFSHFKYFLHNVSWSFCINFAIFTNFFISRCQNQERGIIPDLGQSPDPIQEIAAGKGMINTVKLILMIKIEKEKGGNLMPVIVLIIGNL